MPIWKSTNIDREKENLMNKDLISDPSEAVFEASYVARYLKTFKQTEHARWIWWCLALCLSSATLCTYLSLSNDILYGLLLVLGSGGCAWFWLLSRALFRDRKVLKSKAVYVVPVIVALEAIEVMLPSTWLDGASNEWVRIFTNLSSLVCVAMIVLVWSEALTGFNKIHDKIERRFRILFLGVYSIPVLVAVIWLMGAETGTWAAQRKDVLLTACAFIALIGSRMAVLYRSSLLRAASSVSSINDLNHAAETNALTNQVIQAMKNDEVLTQVDLKVSDLANHLGVQEYKVTRCITNILNYRNFNHMVNTHRIERALNMLKNPNNNQLNISTIAFDCGYNSLGPFNRAFKQHTNTTPSQYRKESLCELA